MFNVFQLFSLVYCFVCTKARLKCLRNIGLLPLRCVDWTGPVRFYVRDCDLCSLKLSLYIARAQLDSYRIMFISLSVLFFAPYNLLWRSCNLINDLNALFYLYIRIYYIMHITQLLLISFINV